MSVAAIPSPASRFKRTYEGEAGPLAENQHHQHLAAGVHYEAEAHRHKRTRVVHFPHHHQHQHRASSPSLGGRTQALESAIASLLAHFPGMDEKVVQDVLLECGSIDAAIKRLTDLKLSSEDATVAAAVAAASVSAATPEGALARQQQQQQLPTTPGGTLPRASPLGPTSLGQPATPDTAAAAAAAVLEDAQQQAQAQPQAQVAVDGGAEGAVQEGPQTAEQWVEVVVTEMLASKDMVDARGRAAQVLQHFERFVKQRQKAELDARLPELAKENQILKRAVQIQAQRAQHKALQEEQQLSELRTMVAHYQEQCRRLELNNYSLAMHLQQATNGGGGGGGMGPHNPRNPDVY